MWWNIIFRVHKERFEDVGSFKDDMCTDMLKDSSEFLTEARKIGNRNEELIRVHDPSLNRNIGKYQLPHIWDGVLIKSPELKLK